MATTHQKSISRQLQEQNPSSSIDNNNIKSAPTTATKSNNIHKKYINDYDVLQTQHNKKAVGAGNHKSSGAGCNSGNGDDIVKNDENVNKEDAGNGVNRYNDSAPDDDHLPGNSNRQQRTYKGKKCSTESNSSSSSTIVRPRHPLSMVMPRECLFKIIVVGDVSTGKTSLIQRYVRDTISIGYKPTLGVDFATKVIRWGGHQDGESWDPGVLLRLQFWDISGQERFANMTRVYYRDSHGAIVVWDCKRAETLAGAFRWKADLDAKLALDNGQTIPSILLANKCDLEHSLTLEYLESAVSQGGFRQGFKVSALTGDCVEQAFHYLIQSIVTTEQEGLYMMPIFQRDQAVRRLTADGEWEDEPNRWGKRLLKNTCC